MRILGPLLLFVFVAACTEPVSPNARPEIKPAGSAGFPDAPEMGTLFYGPDGCQYSYLQMADRFAWVPRLGPDRRPICDAGLQAAL